MRQRLLNDRGFLEAGTDFDAKFPENEILIIRQNYTSFELACISNAVSDQCIGITITESR